jgi:hypothetical protein
MAPHRADTGTLASSAESRTATASAALASRRSRCFATPSLTSLRPAVRIPQLRRNRVAGLMAAIALAAGGVLLYVSTPDRVGTYQASNLGILPLLACVLIWVHRRVPTWLQWAVAIVLLVIGPAGYLIDGGAQWWNWASSPSCLLYCSSSAACLIETHRPGTQVCLSLQPDHSVPPRSGETWYPASPLG